jgi:alpha-1,3-glucosyltransferase
MFMRATVIVSDWLVFFPAIILFFREDVRLGLSKLHVLTGVVFVVLQPALILIDHGHFQYNNICLGLSLLGVALVTTQHTLSGAAAFVCALAFKQMSLYYSLPFFFYLLGDTLRKAHPLRSLVLLGAVVLGCMVLLFAPFLSSQELLVQGTQQ